jgi:hypothetical protein
MQGLIFSYNRAFQLDATLRSFLRHCKDTELLDLNVLYLTSSPLHARLYDQLIQEYATHPNIVFVEQRHFRRDVIQMFYRLKPEEQPIDLRRWLISFGWRFGFLNNMLKKRDVREGAILFLVDDNIFVADFLLQDAVQGLAHYPDVLGFSLRLGTNTTYCYSMDKSQSLPGFNPSSYSLDELASRNHDLPSILKFNWTAGDADFGYPLEVSSSVYRIGDILPVINILPFQNPNFLESRLSRQSYRFRSVKPYMLCYDRSVTFCNPVNKVQAPHQNRAGHKTTYSVEELARKYEMGERLKVTEYDGFVPNGCHQEVEMIFESEV